MTLEEFSKLKAGTLLFCSNGYWIPSNKPILEILIDDPAHEIYQSDGKPTNVRSLTDTKVIDGKTPIAQLGTTWKLWAPHWIEHLQIYIPPEEQKSRIGNIE